MFLLWLERTQLLLKVIKIHFKTFGSTKNCFETNRVRYQYTMKYCLSRSAGILYLKALKVNCFCQIPGNQQRFSQLCGFTLKLNGPHSLTQ